MRTSTIFLSVLNIPESIADNAGRIIVDSGMNKDPMKDTLATRWAKRHLYPNATNEVWKVVIDMDSMTMQSMEQV